MNGVFVGNVQDATYFSRDRLVVRENTRFCGRCGGQKKQDVDIRTLLEVLYNNNLSYILIVIESNFQ